eukprot:2195849-Pleurochrysis_carterae.AAC.1
MAVRAVPRADPAASSCARNGGCRRRQPNHQNARRRAVRGSGGNRANGATRRAGCDRRGRASACTTHGSGGARLILRCHAGVSS